MDDGELVKCIQAGERERLADLTARFIGPLYDLFRRNKMGVHDAEDLVQETLMQCIASIGAFRGKSAFRTWLFRMALNRLADRRRKPRTSPLAQASEEELVDPSIPPVGSDAADVREAMGLLSAGRREVLRLVHEEGLTCVEAARRLEKAPEAVRKELSRAYADLRDLLSAGEEAHAKE